MARRIENWSTEVLSPTHELVAKLDKLSPRELVIVGSGTLDIALSHLIELRMVGDAGEAEEFLGLDADGRAPLGSFGARIQAAYLLGVIGKRDVAVLRALKALRNQCAHRVNFSFTSAQGAAMVWKIHEAVVRAVRNNDDQVAAREETIAQLIKSEQHSRTLLTAVITIYHDFCFGMQKMTRRIEPIGLTVSNVIEIIKLVTPAMMRMAPDGGLPDDPNDDEDDGDDDDVEFQLGNGEGGPARIDTSQLPPVIDVAAIEDALNAIREKRAPRLRITKEPYTRELGNDKPPSAPTDAAG